MDLGSPQAKRRKLEAEYGEGFVIDAKDLPDILLIYILRSVSDVRERMRLSFVCKRFRRLVHSKPMWTDINKLSVYLGGFSAGFRRQLSPSDAEPLFTTINGHKFGQGNRIKALEMFLDLCAPFNHVDIEVDRDTNDMQWMKAFLNRLKNAQSAANRNADRPESELRKLSFRGDQKYIAVVLETLLAKDGTKQAVDMKLYPPHRRVNDQKLLWSKLSLCSGLTSLGYMCEDNAGDAFVQNAIGALSNKQSLEVLSLRNCNFQYHTKTALNTAAIVNACPSLRELHFSDESEIDSLALVDSLTPELRGQLRRLDIKVAAYNLNLDLIDSLPDKLPNLKHSVVFGSGTPARMVKSFLNAWCLEEKYIKLDFRWSEKRPLNRRTEFSALLPFCDSVVMAANRRVAFVKGETVVACKFMSPWEEDSG